MERKRILIYLIILVLIPVFFSGAILGKCVHPLLGLIIGIPAAGFAWPAMFALCNALDEEDKAKKSEQKEDKG